MPKSPTTPAAPVKSDDLVMLEEVCGALDTALADVERLDPSPAETLAIIGVALVKAVAPILRTELHDQLHQHAARVAAYEAAIADLPATEVAR